MRELGGVAALTRSLSTLPLTPNKLAIKLTRQGRSTETVLESAICESASLCESSRKTEGVMVSPDPVFPLRSALRFPIRGPEHAELGPGGRTTMFLYYRL